MYNFQIIRKKAECLIKANKMRARREKKKEKHNKWKITNNIVDLNPNISVITMVQFTKNVISEYEPSNITLKYRTQN